MAVLVLTAISCGMKNLCRRREVEEELEEGDGSSTGNDTAVSGSVAREERLVKKNGWKGQILACLIISFLHKTLKKL